MPRDKKFVAGEPIQAFTADDYNSIINRIVERENFTVAAPLVLVSTSPTTVMLDESQGFYAKLSGSSSPYSFTEQYGTSGGAWSNSVRTGTTNAYEVNGTSSLNNKVVWLEPGFPGDYRFQYLGAGTGGGGTGVLLGCICATPPATLTMTDVGACGVFNDCTILYGPTPAGLTPLSLGTNSYLSTDEFADPQTGDMFRYYLSCFGSIIRLSRVFETSIYGSPFLDSVLYTWTIGISGNTCSPFALTNGSIFFGGDPTCDVEIT